MSKGYQERNRDKAADGYLPPPSALFLFALAWAFAAAALLAPHEARFEWVIWISGVSPVVAAVAAMALRRFPSLRHREDIADAEALPRAMKDLREVLKRLNGAAPPVYEHSIAELAYLSGMVLNAANEVTSNANTIAQRLGAIRTDTNARCALGNTLRVVPRDAFAKLCAAVAELQAAMGRGMEDRTAGGQRYVYPLTPPAGVLSPDDMVWVLDGIKKSADAAAGELKRLLDILQIMYQDASLSRRLGAEPCSQGTSFFDHVSAVCSWSRAAAHALERCAKELETIEVSIRELADLLEDGQHVGVGSSNATELLTGVREAISRSRLVSERVPLLRDVLFYGDMIVRGVEALLSLDWLSPKFRDYTVIEPLKTAISSDESLLNAIGISRTDLSDENAIRDRLQAWVGENWNVMSDALVLWAHIKTLDTLHRLPGDGCNVIETAGALKWAVFGFCRCCEIEPLDIVPLRTNMDVMWHVPQLAVLLDDDLKGAIAAQFPELKAGVIMEVVHWGYVNADGSIGPRAEVVPH